MITLIAAMAKNNVIGDKGTVPWHITEDYTRFNRLTSGHPVIMGRKTHESVSGFENFNGWKNQDSHVKHKLLPKRTNIILSSHKNYTVPGGIMANSVKDALEKAKGAPGSEEVFIIGGAEIFKNTIDLADKLQMTIIDEEIEGDTFFPKIDPKKWKISDEKNRIVRVNDFELRYSFVTYVRI